MKQFSFLLGLLSLLPLSYATAQSHFQPGYVVTAKGDTLQGYIDVSRLEYAVKAVLFKAAPAEEPVRYTPLQATAFRAASAAFVGRVLSLDRSPARTDQLLQAESHVEFLRLNRPVTDTIFLEVLTGGKVSLYRYNDEYHNSGPSLPKPQPMEYGLIGGAGIQAGRISLEGRYEAAKGVMANYFNTNAVSRSVSLLLGYQLK